MSPVRSPCLPAGRSPASRKEDLGGVTSNEMIDLFFLRLAVAVIFIYHALPKLTKTKAMASGMGWSYGQVFGLGLIEFISSLGILGGMAVKLASLLLALVMIGAIFFKVRRWKIPFMSQNSTGWEFDLILLAANLTIYINS